MQIRDIAQVGPDRKNWPRIAYALSLVGTRAEPRLIALCHERKWLPVNLAAYGRYVPVHLVPKGAIVAGQRNDGLIRELLRLGCPVVRVEIGPRNRGNSNVPVVVVESMETEGRLAAEHFHERNFRHVGYVGNKPWAEAKPLYDGFKARAIELKMQVHLLRLGVASEDYTVNERYRQAEFTKWIHCHPIAHRNQPREV